MTRGGRKILICWHVAAHCRDDHIPAWIVQPNLLGYHGIEPAEDYDGDGWYFSFPASLDNATDAQLGALLAQARRLNKRSPAPAAIRQVAEGR